MTNPTERMREVLGGVFCTCYHETGCDIEKAQDQALAELEAIMDLVRIDELERLVDENDRAYGVLEQLGSQIVRRRIGELQPTEEKSNG